jgi:RNA polymerase sigma factor (sigma-70 family)
MNDIVKSQLKAALTIARTYTSKSPMSVDDLFALTLDGILIAINYYDPTRSDNFNKFSNLCISRHIITNLKKGDGLVKQPVKSKKTHIIKYEGDYSIEDNDKMDFWDRYTSSEEPLPKEWIDSIEVSERIRDIVPDKTANIFLQYYGIREEQLNIIQLSKKYVMTKQGISHHIHNCVKKIRKDAKILKIIQRLVDYRHIYI